MGRKKIERGLKEILVIKKNLLGNEKEVSLCNIDLESGKVAKKERIHRSDIKTGCLLGRCKCGFYISDMDLGKGRDKLKYICSRCKSKGSVNKLKK